MDLRDYIRIARRNWIIIVAIVLGTTALAAGYTLTQTKQYVATAQAFVSVQSANTAQDLSQGGTFTQQVVKSYADLATTQVVLDSVISTLKLHTTAELLADQISATAAEGTVVLSISATDPSPTEAAQIANAVTARLATAVSELTPVSAGDAPTVRVSQVQSAKPPVSPSSPNVPVNLGLGFVIGLIIAAIVAALRELLDTRLRGTHDVEHLTNSPILGGIMYDAEAKARPLVVRDLSRTPRAEAFRSLRTNLEFLNFDEGMRSIVVTSSIQGEGKSTSVANLAIATADAGQSTVVVDADLRRPQLATYLGLDGTVGLTDVLVGKATLDDALQTWGDSELRVLPAGRLPPNPSELLRSASMVKLIAELSERFDTVLFDAPPLLPVSDGAMLAKRTSGAIVVAAVGRARRPQLRAALQVLAGVDAHVHGVLVTMVPTRGPDAYGYGYGYYDYSPGPDSPSAAPA